MKLIKFPKWKKQKDLYFRCPKCNDIVKLRRFSNGNSLLTELYNVDKINSIELNCPCGGKIEIFSTDLFNNNINWNKYVDMVDKKLRSKK